MLQHHRLPFFNVCLSLSVSLSPFLFTAIYARNIGRVWFPNRIICDTSYFQIRIDDCGEQETRSINQMFGVSATAPFWGCLFVQLCGIVICFHLAASRSLSKPKSVEREIETSLASVKSSITPFLLSFYT